MRGCIKGTNKSANYLINATAGNDCTITALHVMWQRKVALGSIRCLASLLALVECFLCKCISTGLQSYMGKRS